MNRKKWRLCFVRDGIMVFTDDYENVRGENWNRCPAEDYAGWPEPGVTGLKYLGFMGNWLMVLRTDRYGNPVSMKDALINNEAILDLGDFEFDGRLEPRAIYFGDSAESVVRNLRWAGVLCGWLK